MSGQGQGGREDGLARSEGDGRPENGDGRGSAGRARADEDGDPSPPAPQDAEALRGHLYTELDLLSFALEMEAAERLHEGDEEAVLRLQDRRLGVRLAQRLVSGVWADEVGLRLRRWRETYRERLRETVEGRARPEPCRAPSAAPGADGSRADATGAEAAERGASADDHG